MGVVCPLGNDLPSAYAAAKDGTCALIALDRGESRLARWKDQFQIAVAGVVSELDTSDVVDQRHAAVYSRGTQFALVAATEAVAQASVASGLDPSRVGVVLGSTAPNSDLICDLMEEMASSESVDRIRSGHAPHCSGHAPAAMVGMRFGFRGPMWGLNAACASSNLAILSGVDQIRSGRADAMVVGGFESEIGPILIGSFERAGALSAVTDPLRACRPFDRNRSGVVPAEGAAIFVLETEESARSRGAVVLARVLGSATTSDAFHLWAPDVERWTETIRMAIADGGIITGDIDYISAHAAGTQLGDAGESMAIEAALGPRADEVPVSATKGMHGHCFGGGGVELALAIMAMRDGVVLPTVGFEAADEHCRLDYVGGTARQASSRFLLKDSFGFIGTNCVLVLEVSF